MQVAYDPIAVGEAALLWLLADAERVGGFMGASGLAASEFRAMATEPDFLGFVLDFVLSEDDRVLSFSQESGYAPDAVAKARAALPGGELPHWT